MKQAWGHLEGVAWFTMKVGFAYRAFVQLASGATWCGHNHRKPENAKACAKSMAAARAAKLRRR